jgi:type IV secretory pathway TraG/TraD family ATPase VirD4
MRAAPGGNVRPHSGSGAGSELWPWLIPAGCALLAAAATAAFLGGRLASGVSGHGFTGPAWRMLGAADLVRHATAWPGVPAGLIWALAVVVFLVAIGLITAPVVLVARGMRRGSNRPAARSMATRTDVATLRPSLAARARKAADVAPADRGVTLGTLLPAGRLLQASWEDVILAIFAPRTGKTTSLAVPTILAAPGAVVACSNKADLYLATAALREADTKGRVWVFDPQHITHQPQQWWWNPLGGRMSMDDATRLAGGFIMAVADDQNREIWGPAANELLSNLIFAAHLGRLTLLDVYRWLFDESTEEPARLLREHGHAAAAHSLTGTQGLPPETRGSVYFTARSGTSSLRDNEISAWVTPQAGLVEFVPAHFVETRETLYLLSKNVAGGTSAASLVSALTTEVRVAGERAGERRGGRIDPPLVLVLDEVANICRIRDLPEQYSHMGSRSIIPIAILQSYAQGERVWGKAGMKELWGAATIKLIGSGADDADFAEDISRIVGEHDVDVVSYSRGHGGGSSSTTTRRERILPAAAVRALPKTHAVLLATGIKPAMIRLLPWYDGPRKTAIGAAEKHASAQLQARATTVSAPELARGSATTQSPSTGQPR